MPESLQQIQLRNDFYRDNYGRMIIALLVSVIINIGLLGVLYYQVSHPPKPRYFATSINGRITPLVPLNRPNQSQSAILQWASEASTAAYTYNFVDYRKQLSAASLFFTPRGWDDFTAALRNSNTLDTVKAKKLIVTAIATKVPVVLEKGVLSGRYSWRIQMPILVNFQSSSVFQQAKYMVTMLVTRVSTLNNPRGIGIQQFIVAPQ